jgi:DNA-binding transcriptional LysR family regulator
MLSSLRGLYVFAHVAETLSFSRAAERLGITKSAVSKHVALLEAELSVQLIVRTTRKLVLTEVGERVYESCARIAGDVEAAQEAAVGQRSTVAGPLRVTAPTALGRNYLVPLVSEFMTKYPEVSFELVLSDAFVDLVVDRIDIALRVGGSPAQSLITRRVSRVEFLIVAAPTYLQQHKAPRTPPDLAQHPWIGHTPSGAGTRITVRKGQRKATVDLHGRFSCNDGPTNLEAARQGLGMLAVPDFEVANDVRSGALVRVLPAWKVDDAVLHLVFPPRRHVLGRVRAFADFIAERFRDPPWRCTSQRHA